MDGYTACQKIREFEKSLNREAMPIVALTAHAMQEYRDRCIAAGMNDVITKPVRALVLQELLKRYSARALQQSFRDK